MLKPLILKNGLTVLRIPQNSSKVFLAAFICKTGSSIEEGYFPLGITKFIEKLFWRGTDKHPSSRKLNLALENLGGVFGSKTIKELTYFYIKVPAYNQFKAVSLLSEIIQKSYFEESDIDQQRTTSQSFLKQFNEVNEMDENFLALSNLYSNSTLGLPVAGSFDSVSNITQADILEYLSHQIRPDKSFLVLSGSFDSKPLLELVDQEWSMWNPRTKKFIEPMEFHKEDVGELPRIIYRQKGVAQTTLVLSFLLDEGIKPNLLIEHEKNQEDSKQIDMEKLKQETLQRWSVLLVTNAILGQGLSSRLWTKTVEEELLFSSIESKISRYIYTGYLQVSGLIDNSQFSFGLESILTVLEALRKTTVSINEIAKAKAFLKGKLLIEHEDILTQAMWQAKNFIYSGIQFELEELLEHIDQVDAVHIRVLANELFIPQKLAISTLGTAKQTRIVDKLIRKYLGEF